MGRLLRKITEVVPRITGSGATLNAMDELDRASRSLADLEAQLHRVDAAGSPGVGSPGVGSPGVGSPGVGSPGEGSEGEGRLLATRRLKPGSSVPGTLQLPRRVPGTDERPAAVRRRRPAGRAVRR